MADGRAAVAALAARSDVRNCNSRADQATGAIKLKKVNPRDL
jgi:hypothetical protein